MEGNSLRIVVMGVAGSGKSTLANRLSTATGWSLAEGDDLHPPANVAKMAAGVPLNDRDRGPWLEALAADLRICAQRSAGVILTCSALTRRYRDLLRDGDRSLYFLCLQAPEEVLLARLNARPGHFMKSAMLASQLQIFEPLQPDEAGDTLDASCEMGTLVNAALNLLTVWRGPDRFSPPLVD